MTHSAKAQRLLIPRPALILAACLLYLFLSFILGRHFAGWVLFGNGSVDHLAAALKVDGGNPAYHYLLGRHQHLSLDSQNLAEAEAHYKEALRLAPLQPGVWADISRVYSTVGRKNAAAHAIERAARMAPNDADLLWDAGTFWLLEGNIELALDCLSNFAQLRPEQQNMAYDLAWKLGIDPNRILDELVPASYQFRSVYLMYLIGSERRAEALETWKRIDQTKLEKKLFLSYVGFLIQNGYYDDAASVWKEITAKIEGIRKQDSAALVWNGGFEQDPLEGGFDWVIRSAEGASVYIDEAVKMEGARSLGISFDGAHNPWISFASQIVPLLPGSRHTLRSQIKTDNITTSNGIFMTVSGHRCKGLDKRSESVFGTHFWTEVSLDFDVPPDCKAVVVSFARAKSEKFDNKIGGTAWIDAVAIRSR